MCEHDGFSESNKTPKRTHKLRRWMVNSGQIHEVTANGIVIVSAVGNSGPEFGGHSSPADQVQDK